MRRVLSALLAACPLAALPAAADAEVRFRPVASSGRDTAAREAAPRPAAAPAEPDAKRPGWNLRWRESELVQPASQSEPQQTADRVQPANYEQPVDDPFADPFGDRTRRPAVQESSEAELLPLPGDEAQPEIITPLPTEELAPPSAGRLAPPAVEEFDPPEADRLTQSDDDQDEPSPSDRQRAPGQRPPSPFERDRPAQPERPQQDRSADDRATPTPREERIAPLTPIPGPGERTDLVSCDELREVVRQRTVDKISLDISPAFRPDVIEEERYEKMRGDFRAAQQERQWRDVDGNVIGVGELHDLAYEQVIIQRGLEEEALPLERLSEADLVYISDAWGLPRECRLDRPEFTGRNWMPIEMTWKASGLCHKPLYFEEVQLERYGHTAGPFVQPVVSSAHFFANIAVLPYKMGIHPPSECQYALGYYRPGNCAPWLMPPVPLSLRGALSQTAAVAGGILLIP